MKAHHLFLTLPTLLLDACSTVSEVSSQLKAKPAKPSPFLSHPWELTSQRERAPFALYYMNSVLKERRALYSSIYVAPVATSYLRPAATTFTGHATGDIHHGERPVGEMASFLRHSVEDAFRYSTNHRISVTREPQAGGATLKLALVELNPTDTTGNAMKGLPGGVLLTGQTAGNIAIEGRLTDNVTGEVLMEFADNEQDKLTVVSLRDFSPYEHAKVAIREWARQLDELARTPSTHKVEDSSSFTLNPF